KLISFNGHDGNGSANGNGHVTDNLSAYKRYEFTDDGVSPRAVPGLPGYVHVVATDEHDDEGGLISDEYTNPHKRRAMHEKRMRKMESILPRIAPPEIYGSPEADVTLVGWGSTEGVIREAIDQLAAQGVVANNLQIKWLVPLHVDAIMEQLGKVRRVVIVENNYSG